MKKIILVAMSILICIAVANAQTDTTKSYTTSGKDVVKLKSTEVPASLRKTLQNNARYKGWENTAVYRNKTTNEYSLQLSETVATGTNPVWYRFDERGMPIANKKPKKN